MSKLSADKRFFDVSDYGRPIAIAIAERLKFTKTTPVQVTLVFGLCGLIAIYCILKEHYIAAGIFLVLKSIIDAVDGELARLKKTPSYTGRYLDSIFDIVLNFLFLISICAMSDTTWQWACLAFVCVQLQGTLYNYYYVILRHNTEGGDKTSQIFETHTPTALPPESQKTVNTLFALFTLFYSPFDKTIQALDAGAPKIMSFPKLFMTAVSIYGLGFQLLLMALMMAFGQIKWIIPFFIGYSIFIVLFIAVRKLFLS
ncbi:MAG: CDP-alcohol phosphatidyltransferase family protein [Saprospiraceae bacterium]|nr:CDP-alcohol phosphatidyltransferase family protein [Saprospiraceae bacterium]